MNIISTQVKVALKEFSETFGGWGFNGSEAILVKYEVTTNFLAAIDQ